jgi:hypothetical protein
MKINFLIADEIRPELTGKQTVLGLYPDHTIVLEKTQIPDNDVSNIPEVIERLAILVNISEAPEGDELKLKGQLVAPSGNPHGEKIDFGTMSIEKGASRTIVLEAKPFVISEKGTYHFNLIVNDDIFQFPFKVIDRVSK